MEEEKNWGYYVIESTMTCTRELLLEWIKKIWPRFSRQIKYQDMPVL